MGRKCRLSVVRQCDGNFDVQHIIVDIGGHQRRQIDHCCKATRVFIVRMGRPPEGTCSCEGRSLFEGRHARSSPL
ncbi:hypothetical protein TNIN_296791 [Trichonephila inaurata madagascariensis]|uniref:Uncharacterized protein n=1 Tax=Trichonephila inaurata madagascariensis TaxID=2747483 RepID=A0A8X6XN05_9ARAC|nr:hypothetical protein TNIN_296791 [Trichonephila inaurata madagascariensis]